MHTRYRWFRIQLPTGSRSLSTLLTEITFTDEAQYGFQEVESTGSVDRFRFVSRVSLVVTRLDETGAPAFEQVTSVSIIDFAIVTLADGLFLRIENPPRSVRDLLNAIESAAGFGFTCKPLVFERAWPKLVFENVDSWKLVGLRVVDVVADEDVMARIELSSSNGMLQDQVRILRGTRFKVDCSTYEMTYHGLSGQLILSASGAVKIGGRLAPKILNLIEKELAGLAAST